MGVTFVDEDAFYVTVSFGGATWLARGSVRAERIQTLRKTAECPAVSPDHDRVAYKKREGAGWRIAVLDLASGREKVLPGRRSVDDQVAWLDDDTLLYSLPRTGAAQGSRMCGPRQPMARPNLDFSSSRRPHPQWSADRPPPHVIVIPPSTGSVCPVM